MAIVAAMVRAPASALVLIVLGLAPGLACSGGLGGGDDEVSIDERFIEAHLDFAAADVDDRDVAAVAELGRDGALWGCSAVDAGSYLGITITFSPSVVQDSGEYAANQGYDALQVYFVHPSASDPARLRSTPVEDGTITFTTVEHGAVGRFAGTFDGLRAFSDDPDDPVDVTLRAGSFRCEGS